jgi:hypothetical protein
MSAPRKIVVKKNANYTSMIKPKVSTKYDCDGFKLDCKGRAHSEDGKFVSKKLNPCLKDKEWVQDNTLPCIPKKPRSLKENGEPRKVRKDKGKPRKQNAKGYYNGGCESCGLGEMDGGYSFKDFIKDTGKVTKTVAKNPLVKALAKQALDQGIKQGVKYASSYGKGEVYGGNMQYIKPNRVILRKGGSLNIL